MALLELELEFVIASDDFCRPYVFGGIFLISYFQGYILRMSVEKERKVDDDEHSSQSRNVIPSERSGSSYE